MAGNKKIERDNSLRTWTTSEKSSDNQLENTGSNPVVRISFDEVITPEQRFFFNKIVNNYHTYKPSDEFVGRRIDYLIKNNNVIIGCIGFSSGIFILGQRDKYIGWTSEQRLKNLQKIMSNWRYCLMDKTTFSSKILSLAIKRAKKDFMKKYNQKVVLMETLVEPPYKGTCYLATGFKYIGQSRGMNFISISQEEYLKLKQQKGSKLSARGNQFFKIVENGESKKLIFIKPLHNYWLKELLTI